jgi:hypothetical protein
MLAGQSCLLWPLVGRLQEPEDRELLFDDPSPFSTVSALFPLGALFNHSCDPNCSYTSCRWEEGAPAPHIAFTALRDIEEGEEVCHSYLDDTMDVFSRRKKLLLTYRFACSCSKCCAQLPQLEAQGAAAEQDPLALHFPNGRGPEGTSFFYRALKGSYPDERAQHPEEGARE